MPWPSNGDYYNFKEEMIRQRAPAVSGVYGIYNFKHHILISHSNNIRESLLRHHRETKFRFKRLEPSGFTFEACPPEYRVLRFRQLTWEYQPIIRPGEFVGLAAWWRSWTAAGARAFNPQIVAKKVPAVAARRPTTPMAASPNNPDPGSARRDQFAFAGSGFALLLAAIALFVLLGENKNMAESWTRQVLSIAHHFTAFAEQGSRGESAPGAPQAVVASEEKVARLENPTPAAQAPPARRITGETPAPEPRAVKAYPAPQLVQSAKTNESSATTATHQKVPSTTNAAGSERSLRAWTVQALSTMDKNDAIGWLDRLRAKGYDAFVVEAELKGRRWYRVRVGQLAKRQEAAALEKILQSKEGFRDAFLAYHTEADVVLALSR